MTKEQARTRLALARRRLALLEQTCPPDGPTASDVLSIDAQRLAVATYEDMIDAGYFTPGGRPLRMQHTNCRCLPTSRFVGSPDDWRIEGASDA